MENERSHDWNPRLSRAVRCLGIRQQMQQREQQDAAAGTSGRNVTSTPVTHEVRMAVGYTGLSTDGEGELNDLLRSQHACGCSSMKACSRAKAASISSSEISST